MSRMSVIVISHTSAQMLDATLQSIQAQTTVPELVVVDIGRTAPRDPGGLPYQFISSPELNRYAAINQGIARTTGDYIMILHEGDKIADPHVLADCQDHLARHGHPDVIYGERIKYIGRHWYHKKPRRHDQLALGMFVELSCMLIRRDLFAAMAFDPSYQEAGDYAFVCQLRQARPDARWQALNRVIAYVVLDKMHEGHLLTKLQEDWRVQSHVLRSGMPLRSLVLMTRFTSQLLRKVCRLVLGYPGYRTDLVPMNPQGRVVI